MIAAVKYCGGCNPCFDRGGIAKRLQADFPDIQLVGYDNREVSADMLLVICGCSSECATYDRTVGTRGVYILSEEGQYPELYAKVQELL